MPDVDYAGRPGQYQEDYYARPDYPGGPGRERADYPDYPGWPDHYRGPEQQQPAYPGWQGQQQVDYQGDFGQYALHPDHPSWPESQFPPWTDGRAPVGEYPQAPVALAQPDVSYTLPDVTYGQPSREQIWDAGASQLADWIIADANEQAAAITREARGQAATSLADARKEAAELVRRTGEQASLTLEAAERQAADIRATVMRLSTELTGMATYVTQTLTSPQPAAAAAFAPPAPTAPTAPASPSPAATQFAPPTAWPTAQPAAEPVGPPSADPAASPRVRPAAKPNGRPRQAAAVRVMTAFTAAMVVFALTAGATEVALHGFKFFVFRSAGTGETSHTGLEEDQGPGQPGAPRQLHSP